MPSLAEGEPPEPPADSALEYVRRVLEPDGDLPLTAHAFDEAQRRDASVPSRHRRPTSPRNRQRPNHRSRLVRSQWERITLAPDIELHVRRPLPRPLSKKVDRLVSIAAELLEEDPS